MKIYAIDHALRMPVVGRFGDDYEAVSWAYDGTFLRTGKESGLDLVNVPEVQP